MTVEAIYGPPSSKPSPLPTIKCVVCKKHKPRSDFTSEGGGNKCGPCKQFRQSSEYRNSISSKKAKAKARKLRARQAKELEPKFKFTKEFDRSGSGGTYQERNDNLKKLGFMDYGEYLASPMWAAVRRKAWAFHGPNCQLCDERGQQIHHNWYGIKDLKGERLCNTRPICMSCHKAIEYDSAGRKVQLHEARRQFDYLRNVALIRYDKVSKREKKQLRKMTDEQRRYALEHLSWLKHDKYSADN